jgi:peptidoglycan/LPS O-acetylase OafA/YrhL
MASHGNDIYFRWAFCLALGLAIPLFQEIPFQPLHAVAHVVAKYSYGIYLSHIAILMWVFSLPVSLAARLGVLAVTATLVPVIVYHAIEHPMILIGQKIALIRSTSPATTTLAASRRS